MSSRVISNLIQLFFFTYLPSAQGTRIPSRYKLNIFVWQSSVYIWLNTSKTRPDDSDKAGSIYVAFACELLWTRGGICGLCTAPDGGVKGCFILHLCKWTHKLQWLCNGVTGSGIFSSIILFLMSERANHFMILTNVRLGTIYRKIYSIITV